MENTKETYIDYLVRKVSERICLVFDKKIEEIKDNLMNMDFKTIIDKTEEILKKYKQLKEHIELTEISKKDLEVESYESHNKEIEQMMTEIFNESESYLKSLLRSRYKTKAFVCFIEKAITTYLKNDDGDYIEQRKRKILKEIYVEGKKQSEFIKENYDIERTFYKDRDRLFKDLAPYFFGIQGINI